MFDFRIGTLRPEALPQWAQVLGKATFVTEAGRVRSTNEEPIDRMLCVLSVAKPDEIERFSQPQARVTHTIFQRGGTIRAKQDQYIRLEKNRRLFRVVNFHNHGEMDVFTTYYCEERSDRDE